MSLLEFLENFYNSLFPITYADVTRFRNFLILVDLTAEQLNVLWEDGFRVIQDVYLYPIADKLGFDVSDPQSINSEQRISIFQNLTITERKDFFHMLLEAFGYCGLYLSDFYMRSFFIDSVLQYGGAGIYLQRNSDREEFDASFIIPTGDLIASLADYETSFLSWETIFESSNFLINRGERINRQIVFNTKERFCNKEIEIRCW